MVSSGGREGGGRGEWWRREGRGRGKQGKEKTKKGRGRTKRRGGEGELGEGERIKGVEGSLPVPYPLSPCVPKVVYQNILKLAYVDKLLDQVHLAFRDRYKNEVTSAAYGKMDFSTEFQVSTYDILCVYISVIRLRCFVFPCH